MQCPNFVLHVSIHPPKFERKKESKKNNQKVKAIMNVRKTEDENAPFQDLQEFDEVRKQEDGYDQYSGCT